MAARVALVADTQQFQPAVLRRLFSFAHCFECLSWDVQERTFGGTAAGTLNRLRCRPSAWHPFDLSVGEGKPISGYSREF
jgi:hypothetical protein